jgi:hypothetical protein
MAINRDGIDRAPGPRQRGPIRYLAVGIGQIAVRLRTGIARLCRRYSGGDDSGEQRNAKSCRARTYVVPPLFCRKRTGRGATRIGLRGQFLTTQQLQKDQTICWAASPAMAMERCLWQCGPRGTRGR